MKQKIFFLLVVVMVVGLFGTNLLMGAPQDEQLDEDSLGKIVIQVVDINTGKPVNEVFTVNFFNSLEPGNEESLEWREKTNNKGYLETKLKQGIYYLQFLPESSLSNYELEPSPVFSDKNLQIITVESHKITEVLKKANYGGKLKIVLVDPEGRKINPDVDFFKDAGVTAFLDSYGVFGLFRTGPESVSKLAADDDELNDGEIIVGRLYPALYKLSMSFGLLGIPGQEIKDVKVNRNQVTLQEIVVNMNLSTGIEGYVTDQNGTPLCDLRVKIDNATSRTDDRGYYKIVGVKEGTASVHIYSNMAKESDIFINVIFKTKIFRDILNRKDFVINMN